MSGIDGLYLAIFIIFAIYAVCLAIYVYEITFLCICLIFLFNKAGIKCFKAIIPYYNVFELIRICGMSEWTFVLYFFPIVNFVLRVLISIKLAKAFGKSVGYIFGLIFIPIVFIPILSFGKSQYRFPGNSF